MQHARLVLLSGEFEGASVPLSDEALAIGRDRDDGLVLADEIVSRLQATVRFQDGRYSIRDETSRNGTFINDRKITEQVLRAGDVIEFGLSGPVARFELQREPDVMVPASVPLSATPLQVSLDENEDPDGWIDRGAYAASTGMFQAPGFQAPGDLATRTPTLREPHKTRRKGALILAILLLATLAATFFLTRVS